MVELHFVWPLSVDLPGMGNLNRRFLSPASTALQVMEAHKCFHHGKVVIRGNDTYIWILNLIPNVLWVKQTV